MEHLDFKTVAWVTAVVRADSFTTLEAPGTENQQDVTNVGCSTSIMDLFKVLHVELDAIWSLKWETSVQNAGFLLKYSQVIIFFNFFFAPFSLNSPFFYSWLVELLNNIVTPLL